MNWLLVFAFLFFIGCIVGWVIELFYRKIFSKNNPERKWVNPGFLMGPYLPLYGFGLWGMYFVSELTKLNMTGHTILDTIIILVVMMAVMTIIEYIAGIIFIKRMKIRLWDYSGERFNLHGIICLKFSVAWGILGCIYFFLVNPYVLDWIYWLSQHLTFSFFIGVFFGIFAIDVVYSMSIVNRLKAFAEEKEIVIKYEEIKAEIAKKREELEERKRFIMSFKAEFNVRELVEQYAEEQKEKLEKKLEHNLAKMEDFLDEVDDLRKKL